MNFVRCLLIAAVPLGSGVAHAGPTQAQPTRAAADLGIPSDNGSVKLKLAAAVGTDLAPGPPPTFVANTGIQSSRDANGPLFATPGFVPPLRLTLELPPVSGIVPYATATWSPHFPGNLPSTHVGAALQTGPLRWGTRFGWTRDQLGLAVTNASFVRYVAPKFDLGLENISHYVVGPKPGLHQRALLGSVGVHPHPDVPLVRLNTTLFPARGRAFSSVSTFGTF